MPQNPGLANAAASGLATEATLLGVAGFLTTAYDYLAVTARDGNNNPTTIVYKTGGAGGVTVATLTITYSGDDVDTVTVS